MDNYSTIADYFHRHMEHLSLSVDQIAAFTDRCAQLAADAIFSEKKVLVVAAGADASNGVLFSELMQRGAVRDRPILPVYELISRHLSDENHAVEWLAQQTTALAQPGDVAVVFASKLLAHQVESLGNALGQREVAVFWVGTSGPGDSLNFEGADLSTNLNLSNTVASCLAIAIDTFCFGPMEE